MQVRIFKFYYGSNKPTGNTKKITFSDHLCKDDLIKLKDKVDKNNISNEGFELNNCKRSRGGYRI